MMSPPVCRHRISTNPNRGQPYWQGSQGSRLLGDYEKRQSLSLLGSPRGIGGKSIWHRKRDRGLRRNGGKVWNVRAGGIVAAHLDRIGRAVANDHAKIVYVSRNEPYQFSDRHPDVRRSGLKLKKKQVGATIATSA